MMKLDWRIVKRAKRYGFVSSADRDLKARQEQHLYKWYMIGTGSYACVHGARAHVIEETQATLACSCMDMVHRCRDGEVCKHVIAFSHLSQLPVQPVPDEIAVLLRDQGWTGERLLLPPDDLAQETREEESTKPTHRTAYTEPEKKEQSAKYDGLTPAQMCEAMGDAELRQNVRRGGVAAIAELKRRTEKEASE